MALRDLQPVEAKTSRRALQASGQSETSMISVKKKVNKLRAAETSGQGLPAVKGR
jgi:hypothetical protein